MPINPPIEDSKVLRQRRRATEPTGQATTPSAQPVEGLTEDYIGSLLQHADFHAIVVAANWLKKVVASKSGSAVDFLAVVAAFVEFLDKHDPRHRVAQLPVRRLLTLAVWHSAVQRLQKSFRWKPGPSPETALLAQALRRPKCVRASQVLCEQEVRFLLDANNPFAASVVTPPRVCELGGTGFRNNKDLGKRQDAAHCGVAGVRKRVFWDAEQQFAITLAMRRKRNMLANFDGEFRCSRPGGDGELQPREDVACVVCACKGWSERWFRVYLRQEFQ